MNILGLPPDIQAQILLWPDVTKRIAPISERGMRAMVAEVGWRIQRKLWMVNFEAAPSSS